MPHWSEAAMNQANKSGTNGATDGAVLDCEDRDWEPLAETDDLPNWELQAVIDESEGDQGRTGSDDPARSNESSASAPND